MVTSHLSSCGLSYNCNGPDDNQVVLCSSAIPGINCRAARESTAERPFKKIKRYCGRIKFVVSTGGLAVRSEEGVPDGDARALREFVSALKRSNCAPYAAWLFVRVTINCVRVLESTPLQLE
jgi:hypothetical protein